MIATAKELIEAKEAVAALLDQFDLDSYLFELEPHDGPCAVRIDCARDRIWQSTTITVDIDRLRRSRTDDAARSQLLDEWGEHLGPRRYPTLVSG